MHAYFNRFFSLLLILLFNILAFSAFAQQPEPPKIKNPGYDNENPDQVILKNDTLQKLRDSTRVAYFNSNFERLGNLVLLPADTSIEGTQNYDPLQKNNRFFQQLGNFGQNYRSLLPFSTVGKSDFDYGVHSFDQYLYQNDSVKYYKVYKTYTQLSYVQGAKKEQNFHAIFSRNIYRSLNLGFDLHVASSPGAYTRQKTNHINFVLTSQFFTKNKRYGVIANFTANRLKNYENGGLQNDSVFTEDLESNRTVIPVNLQYAETRIRESGFFMKHYFDLTRRKKLSADSVLIDNPNADLGRLSYSFDYNRQIQTFTDQPYDSSFFPPYIYDSTATYDSVTIKKITNIFTWSNPSYKEGMKLRVFQLEAGIKQQFTEVNDYLTKSSFSQFIPYGSISFVPFESLKLTAFADLNIGDYNGGDITLKAKLVTILGKTNRNAGFITINADFRSAQPGYFYSHYHSNFYEWDNDWKKETYITTGFSYALKYFETGFDIRRVNNYTYLDTASLPNQFEPEFTHLKVYFNTNLDFWRFNLKSKLIYQTIQGTNILRLPVFMGDVTLYYTQQLFGGAATLQPGLNFFYNTSYYADSYNPALRSFYLQDKKEIGNYLYMDVFINLKIQRARIFVTYTHFNAAFMGKTYFTTPGYPMPDGAFKFGVSWRFHD